ncbi:GMC oxidoreductase [Laetiporus sulphureus 93-53]|uniref:GMC oxidoreductase n=1 Tax=Laetiporus sulphureus 93-53 TaxID=1314785 RepID=A0A165BGA6_9APHY|nr:GMC oxidoreductase [Laetiporus sulphureus 93-53]KZT01003.1 GMC oxidoreductase [Laetiporus sulphureus 93-53]
MRAALVLALVAATATAASARATHIDFDALHERHQRALLRRNIITTGDIGSSYDYIIVGGGTAGLVLANRLSANSSTSVLVLEAGDTGEAVQSQIDIPSLTYYDSLTETSYDWGYETVAQTNLDNRQVYWPRGKVLGGSSAINGMYLVRPSELEVNAWAAMIDGGSTWSWDNLFAAMKQSETYTPATTAVNDVVHIEYSNSSHGFTGPLHASYPGYMFDAVGNWTTTWANLGYDVSSNPDGGDGWGAFIATSAINPNNWTRSYSRNAYIDPLPPRANLAILPDATVTKINFSNSSSGLIAASVEYASAKGATASSVSVTKEVILAAGAIGSPQILMVSGVGPADVLEAAGVPVQVALPGVGQHLQDHIYAEVTWKTTLPTGASVYFANYTTTPTVSDPFLSFINSATSYVNFSALFTDADTYAQQIAAALDTSAATLVPSQYSQVVEGYKAIYNATAQFLTSSLGAMEILLSVSGAGESDEQVISIQAALQHPFSQGRLYINTSDVFDYPAIDPQYLSHSADLTVLREGIRLCRTIGETAPMSYALGVEQSPGTSISSDDDLEAWIKSNSFTEYHPSCSCAMLPEDQGGVVDSNLLVYGLTNVRVADASVFPFEFSAHLMAPVYGLAEQAASVILGTVSNSSTSTTTSKNSTSSASSATTSATASTTSSSKSSGAEGVVRPTAWMAVVGALLAALTAV